jgi:hypothetical protein
MLRNEDEENLFKDKTVLIKNLGNVTCETLITFEYTVKSAADLRKMKNVDLENLKNLPFQT